MSASDDPLNHALGITDTDAEVELILELNEAVDENAPDIPLASDEPLPLPSQDARVLSDPATLDALQKLTARRDPQSAKDALLYLLAGGTPNWTELPDLRVIVAGTLRFLATETGRPDKLIDDIIDVLMQNAPNKLK